MGGLGVRDLSYTRETGCCWGVLTSIIEQVALEGFGSTGVQVMILSLEAMYIAKVNSEIFQWTDLLLVHSFSDVGVSNWTR
jgi:hypothetical protein